MENQFNCSVCNHTGKFICYCKVSPAVFCGSCYSIHITERPDLLHLSNPVEIGTWPKRAPELEMCFCGNSSQKSCKFCKLSLENKRRRVSTNEDFQINEAIYVSEKINEEMKKNIEKLLEFKHSLFVAKENLIGKVHEVFNKITEKVELLEITIKQITDGVQFAEINDLIDDSVYAHWLIKDLINSPKLNSGLNLSLFDYKFNLESTFASLENFCDIKFNSLPSPSISYFKPKTKLCYTYSLNTGTLSNLIINTLESFRVGAAWCQIADQKYLYTGGENKGISNQTALINIKEGNIYALSNMNTARSFHGTIYLNKNVYVFGGNSSSGRLKSCEKYNFERSQWECLPNMQQARSNFTPCVYKNKIYIAGGSGANFVECFDTSEVVFNKVPITLPYPSYWTMAACVGDDLILFQGNTIINVNLINNQSSRLTVENSGGWSSEIPVYYFKESMYFLKKNAIISYNTKLHLLNEIAIIS